MQPGRPSRTALGAALHRAAHQVLEGGSIFADPLALRILGPGAEDKARASDPDGARRRLRLFIAFRSRLAEEALIAAFDQGVRQVVILGAGLDTLAHRNPRPGALRVFEADHPATQAWKRGLLAAAGMADPGGLAYVPVDFERDALADCLVGAGFDPGAPAFFSWLGVVPYLTEEAIFGTLGWIAALRGGARVVFDYGNPPAAGEALEAGRRDLARRVAAAGEALKTSFETPVLHARLGVLGFQVLEDCGPVAMRRRFRPGPGEAGTDHGGHVVVAASLPA